MTFYTVKAGDTLYSIAKTFGISYSLIAGYNGIRPPYAPAVGQTLLILYPRRTVTVNDGDTPRTVAQRAGISLRRLYALNPSLSGGDRLFAGQTLVAEYDEPAPEKTIRTNAYAYPFIAEDVLRASLPYFTFSTPFTYGFYPDGTLIPLDDDRIISASYDIGTRPLMHLSTLTENGTFSNELASQLLGNPTARRTLTANILGMMNVKGYTGLDIDFEFLYDYDAVPYAEFIGELRQALNAEGYTVTAALAPKTSADQPGQLYQGHNYRLIGQNADYVLLMTYEWGYSYGPPMAVAPVNSVRRVLDYAVSEIDPGKIYLGFPNYGYDWTLPYVSGNRRATVIGNDEAIGLAVEKGAEIEYDRQSAAPYFRYCSSGVCHEVWFEDVRSVAEKFELTREYGFYGVGVWNMMRKFTPGWLFAALKYDLFSENE